MKSGLCRPGQHLKLELMDTSSQQVQPGLVHPMLQQPLRTFMLPRLSPQALLALRQACQGTQQCVDHDTAELWLNIALHMGVPLRASPFRSLEHASCACCLEPAELPSYRACVAGMSHRPHMETFSTSHGDLLDLFRSSI